MKKILSFAVFILFIYLSVSLPWLRADVPVPGPESEKTISMDFKDASLKDILKVFSIQSGLNFIASEAVQERKITLYMDSVPLDKAMDRIFKANNLSFDLEKESKIFLVKEWGKLGTEMITKVFCLKYATVSNSAMTMQIKDHFQLKESDYGLASGVTEAVKKLIGPEGSVIEDARTNSLIVTDTPQRMPIISEVIASLDVQTPQVMLEVEILDVSKNVVDKLGFNFNDAGSFAMQVVSASRTTWFPLGGFDLGDSRDVTKLTNGSVSFPVTLKLVLDFLRTRTDTKVLARPRILTLNNETAEIRIVTNETVSSTKVTSTGGGQEPITSYETERFETGVSLRVVPQVNTDTGEITMFVQPSVKDTSPATLAGITASDPEERSTASKIRVKNGDTVIIGGLIRHELKETIIKLPLLGDLPILGSLFRHKYKEKDRERELLVFITPRIVKDTKIELAQVKKIAIPEREQNTISGINRQASINSVMNNFEKK